MTPRLTVALAVCLLAGCGGAAYPRTGTERAQVPPEPPQCDADLPACEAELRARAAELAAVLPGAASEPLETGSHAGAPDCDAARRLRDRICELADAICALESRNPGSTEIEARCRSGRLTCEQARADVERVCG